MGRLHFVPHGRYAALPRPRVVASALTGDPALVVVRGGPGSGKTVAAAQIAEAMAADGAEVVWLGVTAEEQGEAAFWEALLSALAEAGVVAEGSLASRLHAGGVASADDEALARAFSGLSTALVLVLDDLHLVATERLQRSLLAIVERTRGLRLVVTTRSRLDGLAGIEARMLVPVRELEEDELAFLPGETEGLLAARSPRADAEQRRIVAAAVQRESAGWPLAVHAGIIERESSSGARGRSARGSFARGYVDRLLAACDAEERRVLLAAALLDEASAEVLSRMTGVDAGRVSAFLGVARDSSLRHWEDDRGTIWYRHHDLVREQLRRHASRELDEDERREAYHRAALALVDERPRAAILAALLGHSWDLLSELIMSQLIRTSTVVRVERRGPWLKDIPQDVRDRYPVLAAFALIDEFAYPSGRFGRVISGLRAIAGRELAAESRRAGLPGVAAASLRMVAARLSGGERLSLEMADRVREAFDELDEDDVERYGGALPVATTQTAITLIYAERFDDAEAVLERNADSRTADPLGTAHTAALLALSAAWRGEMRRAGGLVEDCVRLEIPVGWHSAYIGAGYRIASALLRLEDGDAPAVWPHLEALAPHEATIEHWPYLAVLEALAVESSSGPAEALARLERQLARRKGRFGTLATPLRALGELRARLEWQSGRIAKRRPRDDLDGGMASVYLALGADRQELARTRSSLLLEETPAAFPRRRAELLLLRAESERRDGDLPAASGSARLAAALLAEHGLSVPLRVVPRDGLRELARLAPGLRAELGGEGAGGRVVPLTPSERRALTAIAAGGTIEAAARALFLSENTVKTQLRAAYRKLGVNRRADALRIASDAGLLDPRLLGSGPLADDAGP